jgi:hypothetical protein
MGAQTHGPMSDQPAFGGQPDPPVDSSLLSPEAGNVISGSADPLVLQEGIMWFEVMHAGPEWGTISPAPPATLPGGNMSLQTMSTNPLGGNMTIGHPAPLQQGYMHFRVLSTGIQDVNITPGCSAQTPEAMIPSQIFPQNGAEANIGTRPSAPMPVNNMGFHNFAPQFEGAPGGAAYHPLPAQGTMMFRIVPPNLLGANIAPTLTAPMEQADMGLSEVGHLGTSSSADLQAPDIIGGHLAGQEPGNMAFESFSPNARAANVTSTQPGRLLQNLTADGVSNDHHVSALAAGNLAQLPGGTMQFSNRTTQWQAGSIAGGRPEHFPQSDMASSDVSANTHVSNLAAGHLAQLPQGKIGFTDFLTKTKAGQSAPAITQEDCLEGQATELDGAHRFSTQEQLPPPSPGDHVTPDTPALSAHSTPQNIGAQLPTEGTDIGVGGLSRGPLHRDQHGHRLPARRFYGPATPATSTAPTGVPDLGPRITSSAEVWRAQVLRSGIMGIG